MLKLVVLMIGLLATNNVKAQIVSNELRMILSWDDVTRFKIKGVVGSIDDIVLLMGANPVSQKESLVSLISDMDRHSSVEAVRFLDTHYVIGYAAEALPGRMSPLTGSMNGSRISSPTVLNSLTDGDQVHMSNRKIDNRGEYNLLPLGDGRPLRFIPQQNAWMAVVMVDGPNIVRWEGNSDGKTSPWEQWFTLPFTHSKSKIRFDVASDGSVAAIVPLIEDKYQLKVLAITASC